MQRDILQQHDRLAIDNLTCLDHLQRVVQPQLQHFDVFTIMFQPAAVVQLRLRRIFRHEEEQLFRHRAGTHVRLEHLLHMGDAVARFFFRLGADGFFGVARVEQARARLDHHAMIPVDIGWKAKLPREDHGFVLAIVEQDRRAVAPVIRLAALALPGAVLAPIFKRRLLEDIPVVGQGFDVQDADAVLHIGFLSKPAARCDVPRLPRLPGTYTGQFARVSASARRKFHDRG